MTKSILTILLIGLIHTAFGQLNPTLDSIPMRDGKKLAADIYLTTKCSTCPTILIQTPYNKNWYHLGLPLDVGTDIDSSEYNFVVVDWRGFHGSMPATVTNPNRGEDGYDVIDWISQQSWNNGKVGTWGPSALGKIQYQTANEQHSAHTCAVPLVAHPVFAYEDFYYGGVLEESHLEQLDALGYGLSPVILANQTRNNTWIWAENNTNYSSNIQIPVLMIGGWYDHAIKGMVDYFHDLKANASSANEIKLLVGPWVHGGTGIAQVGTAVQGELNYPQAENWNDSIAMLFFDYHLRNISNGWNSFPDVKYFQMGSNQWNDASDWPTNDVSNHQLYFHDDFSLSMTSPLNNNSFSSYNYDPKDPSPTIGGPTLHPTLNQGPYDQAPLVESRNDLVSFTSQQLSSDVVLKGRGRIHLYFSSDRKDTDFAVRLTDVYPDGKSMLINDGIRRARFRNGYADNDTSSITPGTVYEMDIYLPPTSYTFETGHKIRVDITSSNSRRWDTNLNNGKAMYVSGDTLIANNSIYHNQTQPSYIELPIIDFLGSVEYSDHNFDIKVFPNPAKSIITIESKETALSNTNYTIFDINGKVHKEGNTTVSNSINIDFLPKGMYLIQIQNDTFSLTKKFIKQ